MNHEDALRIVADALEAAARTIRDELSKLDLGLPTGSSVVIERARERHPELGVQQARVLALLATFPTGISIGELSRLLSLTYASAYQTLSALESRELVHKFRSVGGLMYEIDFSLVTGITEEVENEHA